MNIITSVQLLIWTVYGLVVLLKFGWIPSLSHSHYEWKKEGWPRAFELPMAFVGALMWTYGFYNYEFWAQVMIACSGFGLCAVAIASEFQNEEDEEVGPIHYVGAVTAILFGFAGIKYQYGLEWGLWMFGVYLVICGGLKLIKGIGGAYTLIIEHIAFYMIAIRLLII